MGFKFLKILWPPELKQHSYTKKVLAGHQLSGPQVISWLDGWHSQAALYFTNDIKAEWNYNVDITDENEAQTGAADKKKYKIIYKFLYYIINSFC